MTAHHPPRVATWLLRWVGRSDDALIGDLLEEYDAGRSQRWYWRQAMTAVARSPLVHAVGRSSLALVGGVLLGVAIVEPAFAFFAASLASITPDVGYTTAPTDVPALYGRLAALVGFMVAMPVALYHVWTVAVRAPYAARRWSATQFALCGTTLFLAGGLVCQLLLFPWIWRSLMEMAFTIDGTRSSLSIRFPLSLYVKLLPTCGLVALSPVALMLFARAGGMARDALVRRIRYASLLVVTWAAVLAPTHDLITLTVTAVPLFAAYGLSVLMVRSFGEDDRRGEAAWTGGP